MKYNNCEFNLERTIDGDIFCNHCGTCYVQVRFQAETCDCEAANGEPHYHIGNGDIIPWEVYLDAMSNYTLRVDRDHVQPSYPKNVISISSRVKHEDDSE